MNTSKEIKTNTEDLIQKLIELVFEKAGKESKETKSYGLSNHLTSKIERDFSIRISEQTFNRQYRGYILKEIEKITPNKDSLDALSKYIGFENFKKFELSSACEVEKNKLRQEKIEVERRLNKVKRIGLASSLILIVISTSFISKYYKKNCMVWVDNHYEKIRCSGLDNEKKLNEVVLKKFTKVEVCKDSIFFIDGKAVIHYTRHDNVTDFFRHPGEHPIYEGVYTGPITTTIINSRVAPCDAINSNIDK